jgi:Cu-processing system permease protein
MGAWIMARVTFREAARKKILWMALAAGFAFLALFGAGLYFNLKDFSARRDPLMARAGINALLMMGLYAVDALAVVMTVMTSADTLSGEIASGTIHAVATKPVTRWEILMGKWLGFVGMLTLYILIMVGGISGLAYSLSAHFVESGIAPHHLLRGGGLIWLECVLLLNLTLLFGTQFSTLTNGVLALGLHGIAFIGGWVEQAGVLTRSPRAANVGIIASVLMPSESLWRRAAFEMQSPLVSALGFSPFSAASVPSGLMIAYAATYLALALLLALQRFSRRDL